MGRRDRNAFEKLHSSNSFGGTSSHSQSKTPVIRIRRVRGEPRWSGSAGRGLLEPRWLQQLPLPAKRSPWLHKEDLQRSGILGGGQDLLRGQDLGGEDWGGLEGVHLHQGFPLLHGQGGEGSLHFDFPVWRGQGGKPKTRGRLLEGGVQQLQVHLHWGSRLHLEVLRQQGGARVCGRAGQTETASGDVGGVGGGVGGGGEIFRRRGQREPQGLLLRQWGGHLPGSPTRGGGGDWSICVLLVWQVGRECSRLRGQQWGCKRGGGQLDGRLQQLHVHRVRQQLHENALQLCSSVCHVRLEDRRGLAVSGRRRNSTGDR